MCPAASPFVSQALKVNQYKRKQEPFIILHYLPTYELGSGFILKYALSLTCLSRMGYPKRFTNKK